MYDQYYQWTGDRAYSPSEDFVKPVESVERRKMKPLRLSALSTKF